ncbi:MAG: class I SAM-dependent methyltransferase [Eudoraea sp.]|nr:class I SAM-dependent methyltransferase [Eudoraea sp.]NNK31186.1 class I SAM-dependent methyltransferase [Flavobacteriaceae bacterium]
MDLYGQALQDYQDGNYTEDLVTYSSLEQEDLLPLPHLFRNFPEMPKLEQVALQGCKGSVLDVGCGAGSHSLYLQDQGFEVTALDASPGAIDVCRKRGIKNTVLADIHAYSGTHFDTILLLMNGIGIAGEVNKLGDFLDHLKTLLKPGGQILADSTDILYIYEEEDGSYRIPAHKAYYGELKFAIGYQGKRDNPFSWFYIDFMLLRDIAEAHGFSCDLLYSGDHYDYLARLSKKA